MKYSYLLLTVFVFSCGIIVAMQPTNDFEQKKAVFHQLQEEINKLNKIQRFQEIATFSTSANASEDLQQKVDNFCIDAQTNIESYSTIEQFSIKTWCSTLQSSIKKPKLWGTKNLFYPTISGIGQYGLPTSTEAESSDISPTQASKPFQLSIIEEE